METITRDILKSRGFKEFSVPSTNRAADMFLQKKIYMDEKDDEAVLFIDAYMYDLRKYGEGLGVRWSFQSQLGYNRTFNITTVQWEDYTLDEVEEFFKNLYFFSKNIMEKKKKE